jgi:hypothetical protein
MPVVIGGSKERVEEVDVEQLLVNEDGEPSIEAQVIEEFLGDVEWSPLIDELLADEETRSLVKVSEVYAKPLKGVEGALVVCEDDEKDDEDVSLYLLFEVKGKDMAEVVDVDDLYTMFDYFLREELPEETLEDKIKKAVFGVIDLDEEDLDERFKKGDFRKMHKAGAKDQVARMLIAMMKKEVINRADSPGTGYKGGDYKKNPAGYSTGTPKGKKKYRIYKKKFAAKIKKAAVKAKKAIKIAGRKAGGGGAPKKGGGKKQVAASTEAPEAGTVISEGASLAGKVLGVMGGTPTRPGITEGDEDKKPEPEKKTEDEPKPEDKKDGDADPEKSDE